MQNSLNRLLLTLALSLAGLVPSWRGPKFLRRTTQPWRIVFKSDLAKAHADFEFLNKYHADAHSPMPPPHGDDATFANWLRGLSRQDSDAYLSFRNTQRQFYTELLDLWYDSLHPGPIPRLKPENLIAQGGEVLNF